MNFNTVHGNQLEAVIGRKEMQHYMQLPKECALISITDPNTSVIITKGHFATEIHEQFWDVEEPFQQYVPITPQQAERIREFILKNKDKNFVINCEAGMSRSAGIALAIEYLLRDIELYPKWHHFPSKVLAHQRYYPNYTVFTAITQHKGN